MRSSAFLILIFSLQAFASEEGKILRKRDASVKLDAPEENDFSISAEEEARLERFLEVSILSLSMPTAAPVATPGTPTKSPTKAPVVTPGTPTKSPTKSPVVTPGTPTKSPTKSPVVTPGTPTKSPTKSPVATPGVPTKAPTRSPSKFLATCRDEADFFHKFELRTCAFIDKEGWRRSKYCKFKAVYRNCRRTCGKCCTDTSDFSFTFQGESISCNYIKNGVNRPKRYCDIAVDGGLVQDFCPNACDACRTNNIKPTPSPVALCQNDDDWQFFNFPEVTCKWIRNKKKRREKFCSKGPVVTQACPQACGHCCEDSPNFVFRDNSISKDVTCDYISQKKFRQTKYCDLWRSENMVRDICPNACKACYNKIGPTAPPTTIASTCKNNPDWKFFKTEIDCKWIRNKEERRKDYCTRNAQVPQECPQACGLCCEDDEDYTMDKEGVQSCAWIKAKKWRKEKFCPMFERGRKVQDACPKTCKKCLDPIT
jgi:hypothetical protein